MNDHFSTPEPPPGEHRLAYHRDLEELRSKILQLGAMTTEMIPRGTEVLLKGNLQQADDLIRSDDAVNELSLEIEERCYSILALQAPMASELRRIVAIIKLTGEIERSADLMVNVCKATRRMYGSELTPRIRGVIGSMSKEANKMMKLAIDCFADQNVHLAAALADIDDELDELNRDMVEAVFAAAAEDALDLAAAVQLALIARYYERIGDHAVNVGERVIYMVTGTLGELNEGSDSASRAAVDSYELNEVIDHNLDVETSLGGIEDDGE